MTIARPSRASLPPRFSHLTYQFGVSENLKPGSTARNVQIFVYEPEELSVYQSGFSLELLNKDFTSSSNLFEIFPNYGVGTLVASIKLMPFASLDFESTIRRYDFIVSFT